MFKVEVSGNSPAEVASLLIQHAQQLQGAGAGAPVPSATPAAAPPGLPPAATTAPTPPPPVAPVAPAATSPNGIPAAALQPLLGAFVQRFGAPEGKKILQHYGFERVQDVVGGAIDIMHDYLTQATR